VTPLNVCLVTTFYPPYSTDEDGLYIQRLANALAAAGHNLTVVHNPSAIGLAPRSLLRTSNSDHPAIRNVAMTTSGRLAGLLVLHQSGRPWGLTRKLATVFDQRFDVIHYYNVSLMGGPGIFALGDARLKLAGLNDHWLVCPTNLLWKWNNTRCERRTCVRCCLHQHRPPQWWRPFGWMRKMTAHLDACLGPSHAAINNHRARGVTRPMIHLPLVHVSDPQRIEVADDDVAERPYFLCAGKLSPHKGFQDVIPLFRQLPEYRLVICGQGRMLAELRSLAGGLANVAFKETTSARKMDGLYRGAVATIVPTPSYQTFCHSTAASYANGTPVIGRRNGVVEEMITEFGGGVLYSGADDLVQAVRAVAKDSTLRDRLVKAAHRAFEAQFSEAVYLHRYVRVIETLLARKAKTGSIEPSGESDLDLGGQRVYW